MRRFLPSLSALQAFEAAARHLSFTRAAEDLQITQSGVSRQISNLERQLGVELFQRAGSRLILTDAGRTYLRDVDQMLNQLEEVTIDLVRGRKADLSLMVGGNPTFLSRWLIPRLEGFFHLAPGVPIDVFPISDEIDFQTSAIDIAIARGAGAWAGARALELFAEELVVVAAPRLIPLHEKLDHLDFCSIPTLQNSSRPSLWLQWLRASGVAHTGQIQGARFSQSEMLISAAVAGLGLAVVPIHYVRKELEQGELHLPFGAPARSSDSYWVVSPERKQHKKHALDFRDWLIQQARKDTSFMQALMREA
ncbi:MULTISPECIES: LysR substrate-binding domain-containing protein [Pseudomonas]|uniref:LysR family transcriptional regulator n=1 Tax=Pseudomonas putida TaxID=303 RepID=A0A3M8T6T7_PSEPU|nr:MULTISPECIES: LysR substrate-binding domain-containing protein [Pseudomonas]MCE0849275.1 LysR substrate-binding domain-containing protein [Pseudomonas asiatica]RNF88823.1 LysR family transcriptional regulator [Pseudomonas putida]